MQTLNISTTYTDNELILREKCQHFSIKQRLVDENLNEINLEINNIIIFSKEQNQQYMVVGDKLYEVLDFYILKFICDIDYQFENYDKYIKKFFYQHDITMLDNDITYIHDDKVKSYNIKSQTFYYNTLLDENQQAIKYDQIYLYSIQQGTFIFTVQNGIRNIYSISQQKQCKHLIETHEQVIAVLDLTFIFENFTIILSNNEQFTMLRYNKGNLCKEMQIKINQLLSANNNKYHSAINDRKNKITKFIEKQINCQQNQILHRYYFQNVYQIKDCNIYYKHRYAAVTNKQNKIISCKKIQFIGFECECEKDSEYDDDFYFHSIICHNGKLYCLCFNFCLCQIDLFTIKLLCKLPKQLSNGFLRICQFNNTLLVTTEDEFYLYNEKENTLNEIKFKVQDQEIVLQTNQVCLYSFNDISIMVNTDDDNNTSYCVQLLPDIVENEQNMYWAKLLCITGEVQPIYCSCGLAVFQVHNSQNFITIDLTGKQPQIINAINIDYQNYDGNVHMYSENAVFLNDNFLKDLIHKNYNSYKEKIDYITPKFENYSGRQLTFGEFEEQEEQLNYFQRPKQPNLLKNHLVKDIFGFDQNKLYMLQKLSETTYEQNHQNINESYDYVNNNEDDGNRRDVQQFNQLIDIVNQNIDDFEDDL